MTAVSHDLNFAADVRHCWTAGLWQPGPGSSSLARRRSDSQELPSVCIICPIRTCPRSSSISPGDPVFAASLPPFVCHFAHSIFTSQLAPSPRGFGQVHSDEACLDKVVTPPTRGGVIARLVTCGSAQNPNQPSRQPQARRSSPALSTSTTPSKPTPFLESSPCLDRGGAGSLAVPLRRRRILPRMQSSPSGRSWRCSRNARSTSRTK